MNKKITRFFIFCILFFTVTAFAEIYQSIDTDGVVTYSDQPTTQSKPVTLPAVNISTQAKKTDITDVTDSTDPLIKKMPAKNKPYTSFTITSPKNQETFQNAPTILVNVSLTPALQSGDKIYVEPLKTFARSGTSDERSTRYISLMLGIITVAVTTITLITRLN